MPGSDRMQLMVVGDSSSVLGNCLSTVSSNNPLIFRGGEGVASALLSLSPTLYIEPIIDKWFLVNMYLKSLDMNE